MEKLRKGGGPLGIELEPDTATLASVGLTRDHSVWEYVWEDSEAESAKFEEELDTVRGYVHEFMLKHPDMNGSGRQTGEKKTEESTWTKKQRRKRQEMETAVAEYRKEKEKKEAAKRAAKAAKEAKAAEAAKAADATAA